MAKLAFVFPGQGSQEIGMLQDMSGTGSRGASVAETFAEASAVLGYDLWQLIQQGPEDQLNQTEFTQPALLTASVALWRVAQQQGLPNVDLVAGHSLGEYSALVAAGVIAFGDAVRLVQQRGQFMQSAVPVGEGGMAAVLGLGDAQVSSICRAISTPGNVVQAANYNSPGQVVIAGTNVALADAIEACKAAGAKRAMALSVSAPFHSALMQPAADSMAEALNGINFQVPAIDIIQNVDAQYARDPALIRENLVKQMYSAVQWTQTVQRMAADGVTVMVECGPGKVLAGLNRRIDKSLTSHSINSAASLEQVCMELSQ
jgi:[acyl-carrier-protein] S-malonyltransferase